MGSNQGFQELSKIVGWVSLNLTYKCEIEQ